MAKHKLYDESPSIKHDAEGKTKVEKSKKPTSAEGDKGVKDESFPVHVRHAMERHSMNAKHEMEHGIHDAAKSGSKSEMHARHESERKAMHTKHEKEAGATEGSNDVGAPIKEIEKGAK